MEFYAFVHFGLNTFLDKEWGFGNESAAAFNPTAFDADQIVCAVKDGGMKGLILTAKHHDGFCLWPSKFTEYSVKNSLWKNGQGDVVREIAEACTRHGIHFGVYISPWDRNHPEYGEAGYVRYYHNQILELVSNYGPFFEMWFDGAFGGDGYYGGKGGNRTIDYHTYYGWQEVHSIIRDHQPDCAIWGGEYLENKRIQYADCLWAGNESGFVADPCWHTLKSDGTNNPHAPGDRQGDVWCPSEADVSIRPGWFYHSSEDDKVKSPERLMEIYLASVGRGANLILNIPPDQRGMVHKNDVKSLQIFGKRLKETFATNLSVGAEILTSNTREGFPAKNLIDSDRLSFWTTDDAVTTAEVTVLFQEPFTFNMLRLREFLPLGQRVEEWALDFWQAEEWCEFAQGTCIGNGRIVQTSVPGSCEPITTRKIRLRIAKATASPALSELAVFLKPSHTKCFPH
jgi:alpha-L-fucosidase